VKIIVQCKACGKMGKRRDFERFHRKSGDIRSRYVLVCPKCKSTDVKGVVE
jgi:hypothetical protein